MGRVFLVASHPSLRDALVLAIQEQGQGALSVVGAIGWNPGELAIIAEVLPDVVVLTVGIEAGNELRALAEIRALVPGCQVLVVDTLGEADAWQDGGWESADALLRSEQLATELVSTLSLLVARRNALSPTRSSNGASPSGDGGRAYRSADASARHKEVPS